MFRRIAIFALVSVVSASCSHAPAALVPEARSGASSAPPYIVQTGNDGGLKVFPINHTFAAMVPGHDGAMWGFVTTGALGRVDMPGDLRLFPLGGGIATNACNSTYQIASSSDGYLYLAETYNGGYAIARVSPSGVIVHFPIPGTDFICGIVAGRADIWVARGHDGDPPMSHMGRMTTSGRYTDFPQQFAGLVQRIARGPDENIWGVDYGPMSGGSNKGSVTFIRFSKEDGSPTEFDEPHGDVTLGSDAAFWGVEDSTVSRFDPIADQYSSYVTSSVNPDYDVIPAQIEKNLFWAARGHIYSFSVDKKRVVQRIPHKELFKDAPWVFAGLDGQVWVTPGDPTPSLYVFIIHPIVPQPSTITVSVGESTRLSITEKNSFQESFAAVSNNPDIANVIGSGESFTVTGVSTGSTTITVLDKIGNSLDVPVTVQ